MPEHNVLKTKACKVSSSFYLHSDLHDVNNLKATMSKRTRKMLQSKVMEKLIETKEGRQLLLGRALFKRLKKQQKRHQSKKSDISNVSSPLSSNDEKNIHLLKDHLVLQYLEHRSLRRLTNLKERQEDMKKLILQLSDDFPLSDEINNINGDTSATKCMLTKFQDLKVKDQLPHKKLSLPPFFIRPTNKNITSEILMPKAA